MSSILPAASQPLEGVVLLVEDEPAVQAVTRRVMELRGLTVFVSDTAEEALTFIQLRSRQLDILMTDLRLPGMSGQELARRAQAIRPNLKIVFLSGCDPDELADKSGGFLATAAFLQKPYTPARLVDLLTRVLLPAPQKSMITCTTPMPTMPPTIP